MKRLVLWFIGLLGSFAGLFAVKRHMERLRLAKEKRQLTAAVRAVEAQLAKTDKAIDKQAEEKIKTIRKVARQILSKPASGDDANALIARTRGDD